jgi:hypothetical protein
MEDEREGAGVAMEADLAPGGERNEGGEGLRPGGEEEALVGGEVRSLDAASRGLPPGERAESIGARGRQDVGLATGVRTDAGGDGNSVMQEDGDAAGGTSAPRSGRQVEKEIEDAPMRGVATGQVADLGLEVCGAADLRGGGGGRFGAEQGRDEGPLRMEEEPAHGRSPAGLGERREGNASSSASGAPGMGRLARWPTGMARALMVAS